MVNLVSCFSPKVTRKASYSFTKIKKSQSRADRQYFERELTKATLFSGWRLKRLHPSMALLGGFQARDQILLRAYLGSTCLESPFISGLSFLTQWINMTIKLKQLTWLTLTFESLHTLNM